MIKLFEQYKEFEQIEEWLDSYSVRNYTINDDLTVDVDGDINLDYSDIEEIPIQFGIVKGEFNMSTCKLTTLKGSPIKVFGNFWCDGNKLSSLEYSPEYVGGKYFCEYNKLTTLQHLPKTIKGDLIYKPNVYLPTEIQEYYSSENIIKFQDEYGIWNTDGSFNKARWDMFFKDYESGILG